MILEALFIVPQKVVYAKLKYYQDQQDEIVKNILNFAKDNIQGTKISEEQVRELLGRAGTMYALNILNDIAFNCSNEGTLEIFEKAPYFSINHRIFKLMVSENSGNTSAFISEAISMRKEFEDNPYVSMIISQIARKHILYTSNIDHREIDKLISGNVLSPSSKPALLFSKETRNS